VVTTEKNINKNNEFLLWALTSNWLNFIYFIAMQSTWGWGHERVKITKTGEIFHFCGLSRGI